MLDEIAERVAERLRNRPASVALAVAALAINTLVLPGLGTILLGNAAIGTLQLLVFLIGVPLCLLAIGVPMVLGMWVWGVVDGAIGLAVALGERRQRMGGRRREGRSYS